MWFNILLGNHGGLEYLESMAPLVNYLRSALGRCGHDVTVVPHEWHGGAINLLLEHFPDSRHWVDHVRSVRREHGFRVGLVGTEVYVNGAIPYANSGIFFADSQGELDKAEYVRRRNEGFGAVASEVDFAWSFFQRTALELEPRCRISKFFPMGHVGGVPAAGRRAPKDIDIAFFGTITRHRVAVLNELCRAGGLNIVTVGRCAVPGFTPTYPGFVPSFIVASMLDRAKIGLNLSLCAVGESDSGVDPRFASGARVVEMLERDVCVVSEDIPLDNAYGDYMVSAPLEGLADTCRRLLATGEWRERGLRSAARFRQEMDVTRVCGPVIAETLDALGAREREG
jgi:hypothetical protein